MSGQRSADEPLRHVMTHVRPIHAVPELRSGWRNPASPCLTQTFIWARDVAIFTDALEIPLRVRNPCDLRVRQH